MTWLVICGRCFYAGTQSAFDVKLVTDDGTRIGANRRVLSEANSVFGAMLEGNFFESTADEGEFSCANSKSVVLLIHHLYGCRGCKVIKHICKFQQISIFDLLTPKKTDWPIHSNSGLQIKHFELKIKSNKTTHQRKTLILEEKLENSTKRIEGKKDGEFHQNSQKLVTAISARARLANLAKCLNYSE